MFNKNLKSNILFNIFIRCGFLYLLIEVIFSALEGFFVYKIPIDNVSWLSLWGKTSLWMFPVGGFLGVIIGLFNETTFCRFKLNITIQGIIGGLLITLTEFITGIILNIILNLNIWSYSDIPFNVLGQISLPFTLIWILLSPVAIWYDDFLRSRWFNDDRNFSLLSIYKQFFTLGKLK